MVSLSDVRAHNATLSSFAPNLVAIFVGGTSGIGHYTALEFARNTRSPHIYLIGRNATEAAKITNELKAINSSCKVNFIQQDVSLLRKVDEACKEIQAKEQKVNLLFMTIGYMTFKGRNETKEGLDHKFALHYYARARFMHNLAPLLDAAAKSDDPEATLSRVVSVYDPALGKNNDFDFSDPSLKNKFSLKNCATHGSALGNFAIEHLAKQWPNTSFIHEQPGIVETSGGRNPWLKPVYALLSPFSVSTKESGERHLFEATASRYSPRAKAEGVQGVVNGGDGVEGSGHYQLSWNGEAQPDTKRAANMRAEGAEEKMWAHTTEVFHKICDEGGRY
ncbi:hypothetical protein GT037_008865 [Alternaria burnsii]|uniref:NAD(P)-binding protein n=1 Tax=Alternaria burnsii TaxID=1187904 RepID=A0A8H7B0S2_9PLEO|nr:uncharacterized protein GT037_008865 [Alternaria burnsii]KAF7672914.1 hypothetical protein GT037_008865 [Alternaria burnsii]